MHRTRTRGADDRAAMRIVGTHEKHVVLPAGGRIGRDPRADASGRRAVFADALFRQPQALPRVGSEPQAHPTADACDGHRGDLPEAADHLARRRTQDLPIFTTECGGHAARPSVVQRHHVRAAAAWVHVSGGGDGLVQSLRAELALVEHAYAPFDGSSNGT